jgi:hypothetical protein
MLARLTVIVVIAATCAVVDADDKTDEVVELRYTAPPECPTREALLPQISARTPNVRFEPRPGEARRVFEITITTTEGSYAGTLVVDSTADKQLSAARCDDLATALALVTALAIDPMASTPTLPPPRPTPPKLSEARPRTMDVALGVGVDAGITPDPLFAGIIEGRRSWSRLAIDVAVLLGRDSTTSNGSTATFTWLTARPAACMRFPSDRIELGACGHIELGLVRAAGMEIVNGRDLNRLWLATGVSGNVRYPVTSRGFGQLQIGASVPLTRDRYRFNPGIVIHETAPVTGWLVVGLGVRFP